LPTTSQTSDFDFYIEASSGELSHQFKLQLRLVGDQSSPEILKTYPEDDSENIPPEAPILVWFSESMDPQTLTKGSFSIIEDESGTEYIGNVDYDEQTNVLMISDIVEDLGATATLPKGLPYNKLIKVTLETSIKDMAGNQLANKHQFKYLTLKKETPAGFDPKIDYVYPNSDATGIPYNTPLVIRFSIPMNSSTLNWNTITIKSEDGKQYTGTINYNVESETLTITDIKLKDSAQIGFMNETKVTVTLDIGIKTVADKPLTSSYSWSFTIGAAETEEKEEDNEVGITNEVLAILILIVIIIIIVLLFLGSAASKKHEEASENELEEPAEERVDMEEPLEDELDEESREEIEDETEEEVEEEVEEEQDELEEEPRKSKKKKVRK